MAEEQTETTEAPPPDEPRITVESDDVNALSSEHREDQQEAEADAKDEGSEAKGSASKADGDKGEDGEDQGGDDRPEKGDDLPLGVKRRVARANRQRDDARRDADEAMEEIRRLTAKLSERNEAKAAPAKDEGDDLDPNDFPSHQAYLDAKAGREARLSAGKKPEKDEAPEKTAAPKTMPGFTEALADLEEIVSAEDEGLWEQVSDPKTEIVVTQPMVVALADSDDPTEALRALLGDPERAADIARLSQRMIRREIRSLASAKPKSKITIEDEPPLPKGKAQSKAPPPPDPVKTGRAAAAGRPDPSKMTGEEYRAWRNDQEGKGRPHWQW